ncbi:MAG: ATP-binding cassette domain-containing protein [Bacteroidaceae bacterium]|nr:ATP-binding cassette domain-containing protein [Bacteroidaceae bacterium]
MPDIFLSAHEVRKRFAEHTALDGVSIDVPRGRIFGLLGPNGAGKTTLIRIINRITAPDSGTVTFDGRPFEPADVQRIGYLPEERGLYKKMKVGEQAVYLAQLKGLSRGEATRRLKEWFERFGIASWWNKKLEELSKGMQQKVQFIVTVLHRPELLIFDEPFSGFDPVNAEQLKREILRLRDEGHTVIFSTHNMGSVEEICDEMALINHGRVVLRGNVGEVKRRFCTGDYEVVAAADTLREGSENYEILDKTPLPEGVRYLVRKPAALTSSAFVTALAAEAELRRFAEQLPSMHEIFLKTVGEGNN